MAGSTISGGSTTTRKKTFSGKKDHAKHTSEPATANGKADGHGHAPANGTGSTYRVTIDVRKIQANVYANEGGRLSELAVRNWLRSVGFHPEAGGRTWLGDIESMSRLDKSEIVRRERLHAG
jgi:hypothetical protein